jgi:hypothetical protein
MSGTELLGWAATAVFVASYFFARPAALRAVQMAGATLWIIYGCLIGAIPVIAANALVFTAAGNLPYGGTVVIETRAVRSGFDQHTELTVGAMGYCVHSSPLSSSLARIVSRCGGTVRLTDEASRTTTLHIHLPS